MGVASRVCAWSVPRAAPTLPSRPRAVRVNMGRKDSKMQMNRCGVFVALWLAVDLRVTKLCVTIPT